MIKLLICDDDLLFLHRLHSEISRLLNMYGINAKIHACTSWEEIGPLLGICDIAFLDLDFAQKDYTGIDIAQKLRTLRHDAVIIFVTNYVEYAPAGYEVQAFRYMLKNEISIKLDSYLRLAIAHFHTYRETIKIQIHGELIDIRINDILYFESQQHTVLIHVISDKNRNQVKQYRFYASLSSVEKEMEPKGFLRIHKSFIVNMRHITKYQCHNAILINNIVLSVSEKNYAQQKAKYLLWKGGQTWR